MKGENDLTKLTAGELARIVKGLMPATGAEVERRLERLEQCEALYAASESLRQQMQEQAIKDLTVFNQVRERLEKCEALCKYAQHHPKCAFLDSTIRKIVSCTCGYDAARAAVEE